MRILIVDDHALFRQGLKQMLLLELEQAEFGEAGNAREAMGLVPVGAWDIALVDINMPGRSGLELLADLKAHSPRLPVLILSMHEEEEFAVRALRAGAAGYLSKECAFSELLGAIRKVLDGGTYVSPAVAEQLARHLQVDHQEPPHLRLSNREFQVFQKLVEGRPLKQIGADMSLSVKTISTYRARILEKLGLHSNAELVRYAVDHRLVS